MRRRSRWLGAGLSALASLALSGCAAKSGSPRQAAREPYVIGAMFAITGDAASLGVPQANAARMLEKEWNAGGGIDGHPVRIVIEDTRGEPPEALKAAKRLVERDRALAIVGPTGTEETMAVADYVAQAGVPLVSCALGAETVQPVKKWVFKTPAPDRAAMERIADYLTRNGLTRVASLCENTSVGKNGLEQMQRVLPPAGIALVAAEEYGPEDLSMATQLASIQASGAQAVVCWGAPPGPAVVARQMKQLGLAAPLICSQGVANDRFLQTGGEAVNGVIVAAGGLLVRDQMADSSLQKQTLVKFAEAYQNDAKAAPSVAAGYAWDGLQLVARALREVGPDRANIRNAIENTGGFVGIDGVFSFSPTDHCGLRKDAFTLIEVKDGEWSLLQ